MYHLESIFDQFRAQILSARDDECSLSSSQTILNQNTLNVWPREFWELFFEKVEKIPMFYVDILITLTKKIILIDVEFLKRNNQDTEEDDTLSKIREIIEQFAKQIAKLFNQMTTNQKRDYLTKFISSYLFYVSTPFQIMSNNFFLEMSNSGSKGESFNVILCESKRFLCSAVNVLHEISLLEWKNCFRSWGKLFFHLQKLLPAALLNGIIFYFFLFLLLYYFLCIIIFHSFFQFLELAECYAEIRVFAYFYYWPTNS